MIRVGKSKRILIIEFKFHEEIIPTQLKFLNSEGYDVHLFLESSLWDNYLFKCFDNVKVTLVKNSKRWYVKFILLFKLLLYIKRNRISHLVVNTLDSNFVSLIVKFLPNIYKVGIAHQVQHIKNDKAYHSNVLHMDGVLTLSMHTLNYLQVNYPNLRNVSSFYPIFFCEDNISITVPENEIKIVIPGQLAFKRRDYRLLLDCCNTLRDTNSSIKFYLLGNASKFDGPEIINFIKAEKLERLFWYQESRIDYKDFIDHIHSSHYIMPLLSSKVNNYEHYIKSQISASFNWALAYNKTLIIHTDFSSQAYINVNAVLYIDDLKLKLLALKSNTQMINVPDLSFDNQCKSYMKTINGK